MQRPSLPACDVTSGVVVPSEVVYHTLKQKKGRNVVQMTSIARCVRDEACLGRQMALSGETEPSRGRLGWISEKLVSMGLQLLRKHVAMRAECKAKDLRL